MKIIITIAVLLFIDFARADNEVTILFDEVLTPRTATLVEDQLYKISFLEKNSNYTTTKNQVPCLVKAIKAKQKVLIKYDPMKLSVVSCTKKSP